MFVLFDYLFIYFVIVVLVFSAGVWLNEGAYLYFVRLHNRIITNKNIQYFCVINVFSCKFLGFGAKLFE